MTIERAREGRVLDTVLAVTLSAVAFGNLVIPATSQQIAGLDYLLLSLALLGVLVLFRLPLLLRSPVPWIFSLIVVLATAPGFVIAPLSEYGTQKLQTIAIIVLCCLAASALRNIEYGSLVVARIGLILAVVFSLLLLTVSETAENGRVSVLGLNPVGIARMTALGLMVAILTITAARGRARGLRLIAAAAAGMCTVATFITGSRGPLLAAVVAVVAGLLAQLLLRKTGKLWIVLLAAVGATALIAGFLDNTESLSWADGRGDSGRSELYVAAFQSIIERPEGIGWGQYGTLFGWSAEALYPHNLFLEVGAEGGILALTAFLVLIALTLVWAVQNQRSSRRQSDVLVLALFLFALTNAQFSSDLVGNRMLWVAIGLVVAARAARGGKRRHVGQAMRFRTSVT